MDIYIDYLIYIFVGVLLISILLILVGIFLKHHPKNKIAKRLEKIIINIGDSFSSQHP